MIIEAALFILFIVLLARWLPLAPGWDSAIRKMDRASRPKFKYRSINASRDYPAVSIRAAQNGCQAVKLTNGVRYLSTEAPILPLPGCTNEKCHCTYAHHTERRTGSDRRHRLLDLKEAIFPPVAISDKRNHIRRRTRHLTSA